MSAATRKIHHYLKRGIVPTMDAMAHHEKMARKKEFRNELRRESQRIFRQWREEMERASRSEPSGQPEANTEGQDEGV